MRRAPRGEGVAEALYERGSALDSTGHPDEAIVLYRAALDAGLGEDRRRQAVIQLASSLRNLGQAPEAVALLTVERDDWPATTSTTPSPRSSRSPWSTPARRDGPWPPPSGRSPVT